ncbi:metallophosphoesterase [Heliophilum fasciatum]|uniref:metallophosphoesterase n=1 Tax=Heliophilum fasciatum TaxID=35700 RepID=UPI0022277881|nr:metallophosphoesterase [Heliophilum fasciatum]
MALMKPDLRKDRLIMLGDYIDRGPQSYLTVRKLCELQQSFGKDHVVLLRGNHEQMAVDFFEQGCQDFLFNGGRATIKDFHKHDDELRDYVDFFKSLPAY